jgi:hypothetical protein
MEAIDAAVVRVMAKGMSQKVVPVPAQMWQE